MEQQRLSSRKSAENKRVKQIITVWRKTSIATRSPKVERHTWCCSETGIERHKHARVENGRRILPYSEFPTTPIHGEKHKDPSMPEPCWSCRKTWSYFRWL